VSNTVYLSLGSNVGDRDQNLKDAMVALVDAEVEVRRVSSIYETEPVDLREQPWFLNCVVEAQTELAPLDLLHALRGIEAKMGNKVKLVPKGPRLIDLDILLYANEMIDTPELQVPHPRMHLRRFVLAPLAEIAPRARHPRTCQSAAEMLTGTADKSQVRIVAAGLHTGRRGKSKNAPR
jgi:2-amino-4-hydroxy-6-hydroxymethyldihydropteridine diphosphokinase